MSHSTIVRSSIAAFMIGAISSSRSRAMTKPPLCWVRWRGKPTSSPASFSASASVGSLGSSPARARALFADGRRALAPDGVVERDDRVLRQAEDLGGLADRRAGAIGRHRRGEPSPLAAVALVDVLDHLLAPLVLEVDVDVGRLAALGRDEALEQQVEARWVDLGDAEAVADRRIGRRAAPLAEDVLASGRSGRCRAR